MEPDNPIDPITNSTLVPPIRENENDNDPPSITEIDPLSIEPPSIIENEPDDSSNSTDLPSITEIDPPLNDPPLNEPPSIIEGETDDSSNTTDLSSIAEDNERNDEVQHIIDYRLLKAAISGNCSDLRNLISQNPEIDLLGTTPQKNTCLHISSQFGHENFFMVVLAVNHSLLSSINSYGETPLIVAVTSGYVSLASAMLKHYQQLKLSEMILKQDDNGNNALHHAIRNGHSDLALELIVAEPDLSQGVNRCNESPMYITASRGFSDVIEKLLEIPLSSHSGPGDENAVHAAVSNDNPGIVKKILEARPWLAKEEEKKGKTPMQFAVEWNRLDAIRVFLEHDPSLGYLVDSETGDPLLSLAAFRGNVSVAQEILKYCPDAPYHWPGCGTMLHAAVDKEEEKFVEFILKAPQLHKLVNMQDEDGDTALHIAVKKCNPKIVRALLACKATDLTIINNKGDVAECNLVYSQDQEKTLNTV